MILTNRNTQQPMYVKPEHIIMATALMTAPADAVAAVLAEDGSIKMPAQPAREAMIIPGAQVVLSGLSADRNAIMVMESPTEIHNLCLAEMNNRKMIKIPGVN